MKHLFEKVDGKCEQSKDETGQRILGTIFAQLQSLLGNLNADMEEEQWRQAKRASGS